MPNKVHLDVVGRQSQIKRITLETSVTIGRAKGCKLRIPSKAVSREHCRIDLSNGHVSVIDLGSSNGTYLDGNKLPPNNDTRMESDSVLIVGDQKFKVSIESLANLDGTVVDKNLLGGKGVAAAGLAAAGAAALGKTLLDTGTGAKDAVEDLASTCLLYTSPSPRDRTRSRMPSSA